MSVPRRRGVTVASRLCFFLTPIPCILSFPNSCVWRNFSGPKRKFVQSTAAGSGICCLMIVHLKVVLYGNSFHLETRHSRPPLGCFEALDLCCRGSRCCLFSFSYLEERPRASLWVRRVVHFPSRINSTRFHHKKIDVSVVTNPN